MTDLFEFDAVDVNVDGISILTDLSLRLPAGRLTVMAGVSGSGKTSLLRLCNRLDVPSSGVIRFRGDDIASLDPLALRRRVGMVFQQPALFPGTVRDNLLVAQPDAEDAAMVDWLATADLGSEFLDRVGDDLSGGEAQRVCLARSLACSPEVLLMDEPTAALHPAARLSLEATVTRLQTTQSIDVIWVTHDLDQLERMAQHLVVLEEGRSIYSGQLDSPSAKTALATLTEEGN